MSIELGPVPVIVRRSALRDAGIETEMLCKGGVRTADEHLFSQSFMSSSDASNFEIELIAKGIRPEDIVSQGCDWVTFATCSPPDWPICAFRYAYLTEAGPGEIVEIAPFAYRRPMPRPWASWPPG